MSSAAAAIGDPDRVPGNPSASSALDTGNSAPLFPTDTTIPLTQHRPPKPDDVEVSLEAPRSLVCAVARRGELPATRRSMWGSRR